MSTLWADARATPCRHAEVSSHYEPYSGSTEQASAWQDQGSSSRRLKGPERASRAVVLQNPA